MKILHLSTGEILWQDDARDTLVGADLTRANLDGADLTGANLTGANLTRANLDGADLTRANLTRANLDGADLTRANLYGANLTGANLTRANLDGADLTRANLTRANLDGANLDGADLKDVKNLHYKIYPEIGAFVAFKKVVNMDGRDAVIRVLIDADVPRVNAIGSRKGRAERVFVLGVESGKGEVFKQKTHGIATEYRVGEYTICDAYNDDPRVECAGGIHFFLTAAEAADWGT